MHLRFLRVPDDDTSTCPIGHYRPVGVHGGRFRHAGRRTPGDTPAARGWPAAHARRKRAREGKGEKERTRATRETTPATAPAGEERAATPAAAGETATA